MCELLRYWLDLTEQDVFWNTSDTGWAKSAWSSVFAPWIQGACVFVHHMPRFDTSTVLQVQEHCCLILESLTKLYESLFMEKTKMITRNLTLYDLLSFAVCFSPDRLWAAIPSPPSARHQQPIECLYRTTYPGTDCNWCTVMYLYFNEWSFSSIFTGFIYDYWFLYILSGEVCF